MQKVQKPLKYLRDILLILGVCLFFCLSLTLPAHADSGSVENNYIQDIRIAAGLKAEDTGLLIFDANTAEYSDVKLYKGTSIRLQADLSQKDLWFQISVNGEPSKKAPVQLTKDKNVSLSGTDAISITGAEFGTNYFSIKIGQVDATKKTFTTYDEIIVHYTLLPTLTEVKLSETDGSNIDLSPRYSMTSGVHYFDTHFSAQTKQQQIKLTVTYPVDKAVEKDQDGNVIDDITKDKTICKLGNIELPAQDGTFSSITRKRTITTTVNLTDYFDSEAELYKLPITVVCKDDAELSDTKTIYIANPSLSGTADIYMPTITQQPQSPTCKKTETPTLRAGAAAPNDAEVTYQWYTGSNKYYMEKIDGATSMTYQLTPEETAAAGIRYYRCDATNVVDVEGVGKLPFTKRSNIVTVTTELNYITPPKILRQLGTFVTTRDERFADIYKTEYYAGAKFDLVYISVQKPEAGVTLSYQYYSSPTKEFQDAELIETTFGQGWEFGSQDEGSHIITSAKPTEGFTAGKYYIFCVVTASDMSGKVASQSVCSEPVELTFTQLKLDGFSGGDGTKENPYQIKTVADLATLRNYVNVDHQWCKGVHFKMMNDIELPPEWEPIGISWDNSPPNTPENMRTHKFEAFGGVFDGDNHMLTVATGGKPLFRYVSDAVIENLYFQGERINGNGLIDDLFVDYGDDGNYWTGVPECATIRNVHFVKGSTLRSGFMQGSGSGMNIVRIENCSVEKDVIIGYTKDKDRIGSFVGSFNGEIFNSYSEATVYGANDIGGLASAKGQSMGPCQIVNSHFSGKLVATGDWVGGLIATGYYSDSAPNTMAVNFINSYVDADITGGDYVGGLFGGEQGLWGCMNECWLEDSHFYGSITATGDHVGGIIGYLASIDAMQHIENNYFYETSGKVTKLIGEVVQYNMGGSFGFANDAELEAFKENMGSIKTEKEFADGTVRDLLNAGSDYKNWVQTDGEPYPKFSSDALVFSLTISGSYKTRYKQGEALDLDGIVFTAVWSDGKTENPPLDDVQQITKFDPQHLGVQTLTFKYKNASAQVAVTVFKEYTDDDRENFGTATVLFSLSNDDQFVTSDSATLSNVPIKVTYFDLANYGLEEYYQYDETGNVIEQPTMLHLFITALEHYEIGLDEKDIGKGSLRQYPNLLTVGGGSGHMYMTKFWNHNENLIYSLNGSYPLQSPGIGATADQLILHDGDFVDVAMFSNTLFYTDNESGMHYFSTDGANPQRAFTITYDTDLTLTYLLAHTKMSGDYITKFSPVTSQTTVYYGTSINGSDTKTVTTENGVLTLKFSETGTYYLWTQGAKDARGKAVISAPGCATITVTLTQEEINANMVKDVIDLIEAIGEVTEDSGSAIAAAREAYDALPDDLKGSVTNYDKLKKAEDDYKAILNKKAAAQVEALIEAIGEVTENSGDAIKAARDAYNALTDEQKELVENYDKLEEAEVKYVEALIDAIGVVTKDSGEKIKAARDAYDALTPAQRKLVGNYKTLLAAEKRYEDLTKPVTPVTPSKPSKPKDDTAKPDASKFVDVSKNNWYFDAVQYVLENGLMNGTSANEFSPNANTTRGMIVTILARLDGVDTSGSSPWYAAGRTWAMNNGISDGTNMEGKITREQLAAMLYRYAKLKGYDVSASADISAYTDASSVSSWATDAMRWAVGAGLINGRTATTLAPQGNATRAEVAAILMRFAQKIAK